MIKLLSILFRLALFAIFCNPLFSIGQNAATDSLIICYDNAQTEEEKVELAILISHNSVNVDNERALLFSERAIQHATVLKDQLLMARANETKASIFGSNGNYKVAVELYIQSLQIYKAQGMHKEVASISNNIANAYLGINDYQKAEEYYKKSYEAGIVTGDTNAIAVPLIGLAILYENNGFTKKALDATLEAAVLFEGINRQDAMVVCYVNAATYFHSLGEKENAFEWLRKGKKVNEILNNKYFAGSILLNESQWLSEDGKYHEALALGEEALDLQKSVNSLADVMTAHETLADIYSALGNYQNAYFSLQSYVKIKDSLNEVNKAEIMEEMNTKYETSEKEQEIALLNNERDLQLIQNKKNQTILYIVVFCSIFILLLAIYAFWAFVQKKKSNTLLQDQKTIIEIKNREILDSIQYAKRIQNAIIPSPELIAENLEKSFVIYQPKDIVAGDFYWMEAEGDTVLIAVADCTGHGVPGAMVSVVCHNALNRSVKEFGLKSPSQILDKTRELVVETFSKNDQEVKDGMDITLCSWNKATNEIQYAGANNPLYLIRAKEPSKIEIVQPDKQPIGKFETITNFTNHKLSLNPGDNFYLFSDGLMDQFGGANGKKYKYSKFRELLLKIGKQPMSDQGKVIFNEFDSWKGDLEQLDDVCVIGVRI